MNLKSSKDVASFVGKLAAAGLLAWAINHALRGEFGALEASLTGFVCHSLLSLAETVYCRVRASQSLQRRRLS